MNQRIVIIGATSDIARHCARIWARQGAASITLVGRSAERLAAEAGDLQVRNPRLATAIETLDFTDAAAITALADRLCADGVPDIVLIAHGSMPEQAACEQSLPLVEATCAITATSPALFAEAFAGHLAQAAETQGKTGTLALIGSVAGDRGRKANYVYGACKGFLARYAEGLEHRLFRSGVAVCLIKPGPTQTPMTAHLDPAGLAPVEAVAAEIVTGIARGRPVIYAPGKWRLIMWIVRHLPRRIFNRLNI
jgi:short-subunit dehydrogenase